MKNMKNLIENKTKKYIQGFLGRRRKGFFPVSETGICTLKSRVHIPVVNPGISCTPKYTKKCLFVCFGRNFSLVRLGLFKTVDRSLKHACIIETLFKK